MLLAQEVHQRYELDDLNWEIEVEDWDIDNQSFEEYQEYIVKMFEADNHVELLGLAYHEFKAAIYDYYTFS